MGANLVIRTHPHASREVIKAWARDISATSAVEDGDSYSGEWNMCKGVSFDERKTFDSEAEAEDFIANNAIKWESLLAVPAKVRKELHETSPVDEKLTELKAQFAAIQREQHTQGSRVLARAKEGKSELKACKHCSSKVSLAHVRSTQCPVCGGNLLMTDTDDKQKTALEVKRVALKARIDKRIEQLVRKQNPGSDTTQLIWVVGGWCAS